MRPGIEPATFRLVAHYLNCATAYPVEERRHTQFREMCVNIKEVKTTKSKGSAKQEDESSPRPPYSPDLTTSDFYLYGPLKDALLGRRFADDDLKQRA